MINLQDLIHTPEQTKILIADDEMHVIKQIVEILAQHQYNYQVLAAPNGKVLCDIAFDHVPSLILTDWEMPDMNGIQAIQKLRENPQTSHIPIVMITGAMTSTDDLKLALDAGAFDYLSKPFNSTELIARITSALRHSFAFQELIQQREILENALNYYNLQVIAKNQVLTELKTDLEQCQTNYPEGTDQFIAMSIKVSHNLRTDQEWKNFRRIFEAVHPRFFQKLDEKYPQLSTKERYLCALLRLGLGTNEITTILGISADSVRTAIYRTSKKIELQNKKDLRTYLKAL